MDRQAIRERGRLAIYETDAANSHFYDTDLNKWLDDWQEDMAAWLQWPRAEATVDGNSLLDTRDYAIDVSKVLRILKVYFNKVPLEMVGEDYLDRYDKEWRNAVSDKPIYAYMIDTDVLGLYPPPSADYVGKEILIKYVRRPTAFALDATEPDLPGPYHTTGGLYLAWQANISVGNTEEGKRLFAMYNGMRGELKSRVKAVERKEGWEWTGEDRG